MASANPRDQLQDVAQATKENLSQHKDSYAGSIGTFASALRKAGRESDGGGQGVGRMAEWAADGLERVSTTLKSKDLNGMLREVESFARNQPVAFFCAAAAAGFLATRFLKAGGQSSSDTASPARSYPPGGDGAATTDLSSMTRV
jgi:hypothetical protein